MSDNHNNSKRLILDCIDYIRFKIDNDALTMDEADAISRTIQENLPLTGTISDLAKYYNTSETNIRATISRKLLDKPHRVLLYRFLPFHKVVPHKWKNRR